MTRALSAAALSIVACAGKGGGGAAMPDASDVRIGDTATVTAFDGEHVYFGGEPNRRTVDKSVAFPAPGLRYKKVTLRLGLRCPTGGCDWWDRLGHVSLLQPGSDGKTTELELARFITPYRVGGQFTVDVTDLQRVLEGPQTVRVFIDTWVNPGHANGAGWLVDAAFDFEGGVPTPDPFAVVRLWAPQRVVYGDPTRPIDVTANVDVPAGTTGARLRALVQATARGTPATAPSSASAITRSRSAARLSRRSCGATTAPPRRCRTSRGRGNTRAPAGARARW